MNLKIVSENEYEILAFCPFHKDVNRPNMIISKKGPYAGYYKCFSCGAYGPIRKLGLNMKTKRVKKPKTNVNWDVLQDKYFYNGDNEIYNNLANNWKVNVDFLEEFGVGWDDKLNCYTVPVYNENHRIIGIQKRYQDGQKIMIKNSKLGIFRSDFSHITDLLFICEGLSDSVVLTYLGFPTIGRLSATSSSDIIVKFVKLHPEIKKIFIVADEDDVGTIGAEKLKTKLDKLAKCDIIHVLVGKDLREMYEHCGYKETKKWIGEKLND